ncbi:Ca2+-binding actin-bundling protein (actinin), alpha chain (EF-Hand protein superfamily) [Scheffersomyces stipitis CBS 6054]|uniref:Ca2+-binding actin-bundling protein (Actinin), alpha chain (EF-Hand protein superfamily) n=1 Tax=Scheffersomyces stipitis (strain ATCC 58785 / CBS 6054 / NBRC 10063 / NRRL Y-11545) TaxID=322104 RepID=A3GG62_PICST|nr:Ca2+-binding actin-bundling protein (actinin), alpha chain (EF-Hand protein superfamily) [Scheffersomyces stipitis CBS 6054]EAZ63461.2 Ca2+-binding actin-bundling protein (actinin), alpha chain (EF-Hand protein superfamily) [Scheffersomyces stipitis CBS 6054]
MKEDAWVDSQQRTLVRWLNSKLMEDSESEATPTSSLGRSSITNLRTDLQDGIILIKLINWLVYEITSNENHPLTKRNTKLYYLTPIYKKPTFKLQKLENLNDFLKFINLILNVNVCNISADNIYEGDLKLTLGLLWSLFVFSTANSFTFKNANTSFVEIKSILLGWVNDILAKRNSRVSNFNKDWSIDINRPDRILADILHYYGIRFETQKSENDENHNLKKLTSVLSYIENKLMIPHLIDTDDFAVLVPDEKCIVIFLVELYKVFEIEGHFFEDEEAARSETETEIQYVFDDILSMSIETSREKNKYETRALRFLNKTNSLLGQLNEGYESLQDINAGNSLETDLTKCLEMLKTALTEPTIENLNHFMGFFSHINIKMTSLVKVSQTFENYKQNIKPDLVYKDFTSISNLVKSVRANLQKIDLLYYPSIKSLNIEAMSDKLNELMELESKFSASANTLVEALKKEASQLHTHLKIIEDNNLREVDEKSPHKDWLLRCLDYFDYLVNFYARLDHFSTLLNAPIPTAELKKVMETNGEYEGACKDYKLSPEIFISFKEAFVRQDNFINHFELVRFLKSNVSADVDPSTIEMFIKLIPTKSVQTLISSASFSSGYSFSFSESEDDYIFDELQKKVDSQLSGTIDRVYDIHDFIEQFETGFKI